MTPDVRDELHRLLSGVCDGTAAPGDRRLEELLRSDAECRRFYLRYLDLHAAVLQHPDPAGIPSRAVGSSPRPTRWRLRATAAVVLAAAAAIAIWIIAGLRPPAPVPAPPTPSDEYVATLTGGGGLRGGPTDLRPGDRMASGEYALANGVAEVRLDGGAVLTVEAPARFRLDGRKEVTVESGRLLFQADRTSESVRVRTPRSVYLNLGTRYVMAVRSDGDELHVLDGEVRRAARRSPDGPAEITPAGAARRYADDRSPGLGIPLDRTVPVPPDLRPADEGRLLAFDTFDYAGDHAAGPDRNGGEGWEAAWIPHKGLPPIGLDAGRPLPWPGGGGGGALHHRGGNSAMHRYLETPIRMNEDGVYYVSFRCRRAPAAAGDDVNQVMLVLRKWGMTVEEEVLQRTTLMFALNRPDAVAALYFDGTATRTPLPLSPDTTYLVVGKVLAGRDRPDQAFLRVYRKESPPTEWEPAEWSVVSPAVHSDAVYNQVSVEFTSQTDAWLDDLRIGRSWAAVTKAKPPPAGR